MSKTTYRVTSVKLDQPFTDQKPGTSGLRKPTKAFMAKHYTENFVQSVIMAADWPKRLIVGGDGRYYLKEVLLNVIVPICAANNVAELFIGQDGIMSTPAASHVIRKYHLDGGILLTASHNPGGPDADFGIKYNCRNGGPAPEQVTNAIYAASTKLEAYSTLHEPPNLDLTKIGKTIFYLDNGNSLEVNVISSVNDYVEYMKELFNFESIKRLLSGSDGSPPLKILVSGLHGVMGPYIEAVMCHELGLPSDCALKAVPLPDFGGGHPDPNLTYAADLVNAVKADASVGLATAFDGDGDRYMIVGRAGCFVSPCDSLAVIADNATNIRQFERKPLTGFARSMPTSRALDLVCKARKISLHEVPTGWKFFGNLMDANMCCVCGEESFGSGSNHIREKDGMWALLVWLSILAYRKDNGQPYEVETVLTELWNRYGRYFFTRYDFEGLDSAHGVAIMQLLNETVAKGIDGQTFTTSSGQSFVGKFCDDFSYTDPVDHSVSKNQGLRFIFTDGTRFVFRLSGTGSSGATLRVYIDTFQDNKDQISQLAQDYLKPHIELALQMCGVAKITGRDKPTVIT